MIDARRCKSEKNARSVDGTHITSRPPTAITLLSNARITVVSCMQACLHFLLGRFSLRLRSACGATAEMRAFSAAAPVGPILHSRSIDDAEHDAPCMTMQTGRFFSSCRYAIAQARVHP